MENFLKSRLLLLWLLVLGFCLAWAELGLLAGIVPRSVLDDLFGGATRWWSLPVPVHAVALVVLGGILFLTAHRLAAGTSFPQGRWGRILAVAVALLGLFLCLNQFAELENLVSQVTDFGTIYRGSSALFAGDDPYTVTDNAYFYPPLLAFLFGPLTLLPPAGASTLFFSLKFIMLVWALLACDRLVEGSLFSGGRRTLFVFGLIFVAARFWVTDLQFGNTNVVIMFLMIAAIVLDRDDRPLAAGLALALAVSIKIVPVVLGLHFLILGRWRTLMFFAAALAVINLLPWILLQGHWGDAWGAYFDAGVTGKLNQRLIQPDNQSLWGVTNRMFPAVPLNTLRWVWAGAAALLGAGTGLVSFRSRDREPLVQVAAVSLYPLLGLLVSPGSWVVHYTAVLLPMAMLWKLALSGMWSVRWAWLLFLITNVAFTVSGWARPTVKASITQSWFVAAAFLLMVGIGSWASSYRRD